MAKYLQFLKVLLALRTKLPGLLAALQPLITWVQDTFPPTESEAAEGGLQIVAETRAVVCGETITAEVVEVEQQVAAELVTDRSAQAAFDGSRLRAIFAILQATGLADALMAYLMKRLGM